ncbi:ABC transporter substrate-binding protein [Rugamonas aquatica]|uniref:Transporter substrate-binding domain-containing protein n=1 Tax=Rugamonas aquatica TaxID=2743357 RepID=A0A6A7N9H8_9BURK|nr:ABC transporter substrate-binding protein [Rugamonas aquatica]MQA41548.1 hypothetical protein [Rugamonas aquatica]
MAIRAGILLMLATLTPLAQSAGVCTPLRVGYMDQNRPPYWMGEGEQVPEPPGAAVDLIRNAVMGSGFNCLPTLVRLPVARLRVALEAGDIDMTPLAEQPSYAAEIALPRDKDGHVDRNRALHNTVVVLVRVKDKIPSSANPNDYFRGKVLGSPQGNSYNARLREAGLTIDDGARDLERNIEKLKLGRVDGVVVNLVKPEHLALTLKRYHGAVVQLPQPLINTRLWLAFNAGYYRAHHDQVEALWSWLDAHRGRLGDVMQKYRKPE